MRVMPEGFSANVIELLNALQITEEWQCAHPCRVYVVFAARALHFAPISASFPVIGDIFGKSKGVMVQEYEEGGNSIDWHEGSGLPSDAQLEEMVAYMLDCFARRSAAAYQTIADFLQSEMSITVPLRARRYLLHSNSSLRTVVGIPMEREGIEVDPREIEDFYDGLCGQVTVIPSARFFNLDETGH
jgi:hypothetical protein